MLLSSISLALTRLGQRLGRAWSPLALWPDGVDSPGMWIDPSLLTASFNDYAGTTPVATPGSVADSANPVGLALDIRAGAPTTLGPELVSNPGNPFTDTSGFMGLNATLSVVSGRIRATATSTADAGLYYDFSGLTKGAGYFVEVEAYVGTQGSVVALSGLGLEGESKSTTSDGTLTAQVCSTITGGRLIIRGTGGSEPGKYIEVGSVSFKEIPGNHMLQSTSAARPLESALVNLLTKTEELNNAIWISTLAGSTITSGVSDPLGGTTAFTITATSPNGQAYQNLNTVTLPRIASGYIRRRSGSGNVIFFADGGAGGTNITAQVTPSWMPFSVASSTSVGSWYVLLQNSGDAIDVWHPQVETGSVATTYQRVGAASDYTATGFPIYQKYDGVDDGMATAAFTAGTLINGMDCMIAVRRDSWANCVAGLYNGIADATKFFGMAESGSGSGCVGSGAGTPTVWVDGVQLSGGTAVTRGTLHTALTVGDWHILEFRGLDLSTWTAAGFGLYTSYVFPGARGDILLYPSTASTEDKDAARQYLADKYGVTLAPPLDTDLLEDDGSTILYEDDGVTALTED